jgi:mannan endo-1,4-beta-mannosidase
VRARQLTLNSLTAALTLMLLALLTLPAVHILRASGSPAGPPPRLFGVYVDPWHVDDWARAERIQPELVAKFESFSRRRAADKFLDEAERKGIRRVLIAWEPWKPVPVSVAAGRQAAPQRGYRNVDIALGAQDGYIRRFARSLARFDGTVYLRYAHEMNGYWYPWSSDPVAYRRAWRHVVALVRAVAPNVAFVWSVNTSLYEPYDTWTRHLRQYWPGAAYVDVVGATMINFGGWKQYDVPRFASRIRALRWNYGKPVVLAETNTAYQGRVAWLRDLRRMLRTMPFVRGLVWSQLPSRGAAHLRGVGVGLLDWEVQRDPAATTVLRAIAHDGSA